MHEPLDNPPADTNSTDDASDVHANDSPAVLSNDAATNANPAPEQQRRENEASCPTVDGTCTGNEPKPAAFADDSAISCLTIDQTSVLCDRSMSSKPFTESLREFIRQSGRTQDEICKAIGLDNAVLSRFLAGKSGLALVTVDKLLDVLGLELRSKSRRRTRKAR